MTRSICLKNPFPFDFEIMSIFDAEVCSYFQQKGYLVLCGRENFMILSIWCSVCFCCCRCRSRTEAAAAAATAAAVAAAATSGFGSGIRYPCAWLTMKQSSNLPAFLSKLWTLVEETHTNEFITWSQNGQSFLVLDEQKFAKEILPKYFKHSKMASFVRQLNTHGFRKVVHINSGIIKQERDGPVEFQHPYFKQSQDDLSENIKRKVSSSKPEENKIRQEDLTKIISSAQKVQIKQ
ncbi:hypothetical protein STEG23_032578 [Scotinomys teguina]